MFYNIARAFLLLLTFISYVTPANVLFFLHGTNQFDRHIFEFLAQQIALRHHNVVTVKPILVPEEPRLVKPRLHLVREKIIKNTLPKELYGPIEDVSSTVPWNKNYELDSYNVPYWAGYNASCYKLINSNLMETIKRDQIEVAVIYNNNPCQLAIVHALSIPFIYFDLEGLSDETIIASGMPWNLNTVSSRTTPSSKTGELYTGLELVKESLCQLDLPFITNELCTRVRLVDNAISKIFREDYDIKKKFKHFPHVNQIKQSAEFYFVNTDSLLESDRSWPSNVVPVGGTHIDFPKPLFYPWNTSISSAPAGLILVQLGANVDGSAMPEHLVKAFVGALSKLTKYRIYWRIGTNLYLKNVDIDSLPSHINVTTYIPQNDLLAHRRCKLLITNGGMSSIMEALTYGVPLLGLPLYGVNYKNLWNVEQQGLGLMLRKDKIDEKILLQTMKKLLDTPIYKKKAEDFSKALKSRPGTAFERVLHAIEHVAKHGAAKFYKNGPKKTGLALYLEVHHLDFYLIVISGLSFLLFVAFTVLRMFSRFMRRGGDNKEKLKKH
ncbi:unnamed protein product [Bursaphelenchus okinawaensis]|uniref:glucuronosyltransferase n=1 Tax=Bursaphelenchus okinawaensis TaxID=465554 RepID=A0A811K4U0_9BILA|nr:unnamed protein product [Bursaphelenchus okinawaensis]CAG9091354.1 unnamed protein product [Bursaphelenchus okinawaensis]